MFSKKINLFLKNSLGLFIYKSFERMALTQKYGIKYPFTSDNTDEVFLDLNETYEDSVKSSVLHVIFTPKGQRLRRPDFGTDLIKYIFDPNDGGTIDNIKSEIRESVGKYVPGVEFEDISVYDDDNSNSNGKIVIVHYKIKRGASETEETVAVKI